MTMAGMDAAGSNGSSSSSSRSKSNSRAGGADKAILISISGISSSGKTTVSRLIRDIFPGTFILHEDDFFVPEKDVPTHDGFQDWDCPEAIAVSKLDETLAHIRSHGSLPPNLRSVEDQNSVGPVPVSPSVVSALKSRVAAWLQPSRPGHALATASSPAICILDGFLLYAPPLDPATRHLHAKLLLLASRDRALERRRARDGYATMEGFWIDPPGYAERIVWANYAVAHAWLFRGGDVDAGVLDGEVLARAGIRAMQTSEGRGGGGDAMDGRGGEDDARNRGRPAVDVDPDSTLEWAVGEVMAAVERFFEETAEDEKSKTGVAEGGPNGTGTERRR